MPEILPAHNELAAALRMLRGRGFTQLPRKGEVRCFEGELACQHGAVQIRLTIRDWDFVRYPAIQVLEGPLGLHGLLPHLDANRELCYLANGSVILDRFHPEHAIAQCLDVARLELDRLLTGSRYRQNEFQSEFGASWNVGQRPLPWSVLLGTVEAGVDRAGALLVGPLDERMLAISSDPEEIPQLCAVQGWPAPDEAALTCWIIRSDYAPTLPAGGLPSTVGEMFAWIKAWDRQAYTAICGVLGQPDYLAQPQVMFLLQSQAGWFGFDVALDLVKRKAFRRKPFRMRQSLHGRGGSRPIRRVAVQEIGPDFVHSRNLTYPSLKDRQITVIGCGAIGGYLAQALVRLGAGRGTGQLTLIDPEFLRAENLGRHWLGYDYLLQPKAEAVERRLRQEFPGINVKSLVREVRRREDLRGDLVIDATGEEALSEALNYHRLQIDASRRPPLLHAWIVGNGDCAQALWTDSAQFACYRCLRCNDLARTPRFPVANQAAERRNFGCHAFTPFAVSAPMTAAALACDLVTDWMRGTPSPRFRTRAAESADVRKLKAQNLTPLKDCPACSAR